MEQELTNMLELLREGLSELPTIGSDVFNIYVRGIQIEGGVQVVTFLIILSTVIYLIRYFKNKLDNRGDSNTSGNLEILIITILIALLIASIATYFGIYDGLLKLFAPDYMLIKEVIGVLGGY